MWQCTSTIVSYFISVHAQCLSNAGKGVYGNSRQVDGPLHASRRLRLCTRPVLGHPQTGSKNIFSKGNHNSHLRALTARTARTGTYLRGRQFSIEPPASPAARPV